MPAPSGCTIARPARSAPTRPSGRQLVGGSCEARAVDDRRAERAEVADERDQHDEPVAVQRGLRVGLHGGGDDQRARTTAKNGSIQRYGGEHRRHDRPRSARGIGARVDPRINPGVERGSVRAPMTERRVAAQRLGMSPATSLPSPPRRAPARRAAAIASAASATPTATSRRCAASTSTSARGEILALLGPNGAGKTSTVEVLEGFRDAHRRRGRGARATTRARRPRLARPHRDRAPGVRARARTSPCASACGCTPATTGAARRRRDDRAGRARGGRRERRRARSPAASAGGSTSRSRSSATPS